MAREEVTCHTTAHARVLDRHRIEECFLSHQDVRIGRDAVGLL